MPYGFDKQYGGDSPENVAAIESCVRQLMAEGKTKESAIRICKSSRKQSLRRKRRKR